MISYILYPGDGRTSPGSEIIYIGPNTLCDLYGVKRIDTLCFSQGLYYGQGVLVKPKNWPLLLKLVPREDGIYRADNCLGWIG